MPGGQPFLTFAAAALALLVVPGPVVLYIVSRSVERGRMAAVVSVLGIGTASFCHAALAVAGIGSLLTASPATFHTVQYAGAAWLVWLGISELRRGGGAGAIQRGADQSLRGVYAEGFMVNILNPKAPIFFFAFLPQFVDPARGSAAAQVAWLGGAFALLGMTTDSLWALAARAAGQYLTLHPRLWGRRHYVTGAILIALGAGAGLAAVS